MKPSVFLAFFVYFLCVIGVGVYFYNKLKNMKEYFLGGRNLNSWVTAMSAQAADMSGWLLMGLPAAAYISGVSASWIAIGAVAGGTICPGVGHKVGAVVGDMIMTMLVGLTVTKTVDNVLGVQSEETKEEMTNFLYERSCNKSLSTF